MEKSELRYVMAQQVEAYLELVSQLKVELGDFMAGFDLGILHFFAYLLKSLQTIQTVRNKQENFEGKAETIFETSFIAQSHAESLNEIMGADFEGMYR